MVPRRKKNDHPLRRKIFLTLGVCFFVFAGWVLWSAYALVRDLPSPQTLSQRTVAESTKIYDRTGTVLLYEIHGEEKRTIIPISQIPDEVKQATLAAEDAQFYQHGALYWRGILRALFKNITTGDTSQGGSTITQQLVKNSLLTNERTYTRKIKEAFLAVLVERKYTKDEILELYLNQIPYGSNAYGIAAASETFFNKKPQDLTLAEAATLAAMPKAPTYYSPYGSHKEELLARKDWILDRMTANHMVTPERIAEAKRAPISFPLPRQSIRAPHFVMYVKEYLSQKYGDDLIERGGLKVTTTLDWRLEEEAEKAVQEGAVRNEKLVNAKNAALVAIDPKSGDILAMVGSRDYFDVANDGNVNVATRPRQPGSSFKPFVYATAFKKGYTPDTILFDVPTEFSTTCSPQDAYRDDHGAGADRGCYHPKNYDDTFRGPVTLRQAIAQSLNIPAVKLLYLVSPADAIQTAEAMGISTLGDPKRYGLSLVLGGAEVTLLDMTSAFSAFANDGILEEKTAVLKVEDNQGIILEEHHPVARPVIEPDVARAMNTVLSDNNARVPVFSPQSALYFPDRTVAAKTGTTQDYRDAWTIGYTPSLAVGVWVGNNNNEPINQGGISVMVAAPIWHRLLAFALNGTPAEEFLATHLPATKPIFRGIYQSGVPIKIDRVSGKLASAYTPPELIREVGTGPITTILTLVDKNNPNGDPPAHPERDPQERNWQEGIDLWLANHPLPQESIPLETETTHTPESSPHISFPDIDDTKPASSPVTHITARITSGYPLREATLFVNDELADAETGPFPGDTILFQLNNPLSPGSYTIKVITYDTVGNKTTETKQITVAE